MLAEYRFPRGCACWWGHARAGRSGQTRVCCTRTSWQDQEGKVAGACRAPEQLSGVLAAARTGAPLGSAGRSGQEQGFLKSPLARGGDRSLSPHAVSTWDAHGAAKPRGTGTAGEGSSSP